MLTKDEAKVVLMNQTKEELWREIKYFYLWIIILTLTLWGLLFFEEKSWLTNLFFIIFPLFILMDSLRVRKNLKLIEFLSMDKEDTVVKSMSQGVPSQEAFNKLYRDEL